MLQKSESPSESAIPRPLLGLLVALFLANAAISVWGNLRLYSTSGQSGFLPAGKGPVVKVGQVRPGGPAEALRTGEEILALDGRGVRGPEDVWRFFLHRPPGPYEITVRRDGRPLVLRLEAPPYQWGWATSFGLGRLAVHLFFVLSALVLFLLRPEGKAGLLLCLAFLFFLPGDLLSYAPDKLPPLSRAVVILCDTLSFLFFPVFLHFLLVFPEPSPILRRWPFLEKALYLPTLCVMLAAAPVYYLYFVDLDLALGVIREARWFPWLVTSLWLGSTFLGLVALVTSYAHASRTSRRKLRVAVVGTVAGFLPLIVLLGANALFERQGLSVGVSRALGLLSLFTLPLVPLSFGYAILRHQVIPVRALVRRGLRYLLVSRGVVLLEGLFVVGLVAWALSGRRGAFVDAIGPRADIVVALIAGGLILVGLHRLNRHLRSLVDRRFFREAYDARQVLTSLSEEVREVPDAKALVDLVAARVREALHPESVHLFVRDEASGSVRRAYPHATGKAEAAPTLLVERLSGMDHVLSFEGGEPGPGGLVLAFAMRGRRELMGILGLGPRLGDLAYTREDRQLLRSVASQAGLSLENGGLIRRVAEQERVAHELAIAAEVQRRLFPDRAPACRTLDLAGLCVPAGDVGGDYYDFLELGEGRVGFAVADVAGKGLPAAILMSMVQASLRSQADGGRATTEICDSMNRLLYRSTAPNAYATFFYGVFEPDTRHLCFVNAGHNPPLVVRARPAVAATAATAAASTVGGMLAVAAMARTEESEEAERLRATGLVLGAVSDSPYLEESVQLQPGDVVVAYTDGVTEAFGPGGQEFGEERLFEVVASARGLPASAIVERVARAVEAWRGGAPAHDDLTLVVARVL
jgi:sigma-B regulation protein RsbU (phosphoserine phosphatase)